MLTIRLWFNEMDQQLNGHVTKAEWLEFLRKNNDVKHFMIDGGMKGHKQSTDRQMERFREEVKEMRRLLFIWREIDENHNGYLEWDEFVEFFRRSGNLLEYRIEENPKTRLAEYVGKIHDSPSDVSETMLEELEDLAKYNLTGEKRRLVESEVVTMLPTVHSPTKDRMIARVGVDKKGLKKASTLGSVIMGTAEAMILNRDSDFMKGVKSKTREKFYGESSQSLSLAGKNLAQPE